jgi:hypothetical protein
MDDRRFIQSMGEIEQARGKMAVLQRSSRAEGARHIRSALAVATMLGALIWLPHGSATVAARQATIQGGA